MLSRFVRVAARSAGAQAARSVSVSAVSAVSISSKMPKAPHDTWVQRRAFCATPAAEAVTVKVPGMGDSISEGELGSWFVEEGQAVDTDALLAEIETDKITVEIRAPRAGTLVKRFAKQGETVRVGSDLYQLLPGAAPAAAPAAAAAPKKAEAKAEAPKAAPAAPVAPVAPVASAPAKTAEPAKKEAAPVVAPVVVGERTDRRVKMKKMRARTAERLKDSQNTYAMLTTFNEIDMTELLSLRQEYKDAFEKKYGVKLGFMSAFIKASTEALVAAPLVNAVIDGDDIVYRDYVDVSVAVASPNGLVVPVLRNVERMSLADIERQVAALADKARDNKLTAEDMAGGTFTISNGGVFGSMMGTPIINPPQSAILGMHATKPRPVARNGVVEIRPIMYVALTYDHRLIDGREAVTFLVHVKNLIEDPRRMLLNL